MLARRIVAALGLSLTLSQCTTNDAPVATNSAAIMGGETDTTDTNVVGIVVRTSQGIATCSGSLLLPNLVLTARHCVSQLSTQYFACQTFTDPSTGQTLQTTTAAAPYPARNFSVTTDTTIEIFGGGNSVDVSAVLVPPNTTGTPICGKDIALLRLATPITDAGTRTPRLDVAPQNGETFTAIGYGAVDGANHAAGTRRIRSGLTIQYVGSFMDRGVTFTQDAEWIGDTGTCEGDSGGPSIDETGQIIGIVSRGGAMTCDEPVYTRVDSFAEWIRAQAQTAATMGGYTPPDWVAPPATGTANFGDPCRSNDQCVSPLSCLPIDGQFRCTDEACNCPDHWICGMTNTGYQACVPDPNNPAPSDAGAPGDASADDGSADGGAGMRSGGCAVNASHGDRGARGTVGMLALVALAFASRRRRR
jgi:MYXO-CTERM domain-containing protein